MIVSTLSQKGGAGKSMLTQLLAVECGRGDLDVLVADMDTNQHTTTQWAQKRGEASILPAIKTISCERPAEAIQAASLCDVLFVDGTPFANHKTAELASNSDWVIIPTGISAADLDPAIELAYQLASSGKIDAARIVFVVVKVPKDGDREAMITKQGIKSWGFLSVDTWLPMRTGYSQAMDNGLSVCETRFPALNDKAIRIFQQINEIFANGDNHGQS